MIAFDDADGDEDVITLVFDADVPKEEGEEEEMEGLPLRMNVVEVEEEAGAFVLELKPLQLLDVQSCLC